MYLKFNIRCAGTSHFPSSVSHLFIRLSWLWIWRQLIQSSMLRQSNTRRLLNVNSSVQFGCQLWHFSFVFLHFAMRLLNIDDICCWFVLMFSFSVGYCLQTDAAVVCFLRSEHVAVFKRLLHVAKRFEPQNAFPFRRKKRVNKLHWKEQGESRCEWNENEVKKSKSIFFILWRIQALNVW